MGAYYNSDAPARAARLFKIVTMIASRRLGERLGREELAEACDCTSKTIQRDIQCLQDANIPLHYDREARSYLLMEGGWAYPFAPMTATDVMALALARGLLLNTTTRPPFADEMDVALQKATGGLTPALRSQLASASRALTDRGGAARDYSHAPVGPLLEAIRRYETVEMRYDSRSSGVCDLRRVDPYRLDRRDGRYFELHGWCHRREEVRTFALDRIMEIKLTGDIFQFHSWDEDDEGVIGGLRGGQLVEVVIRFHPKVEPYARERNWGLQPKFERNGDGSLLLWGKVRGVEGMVRELLGWQHFVTVLGGPELRQRMVEEIEAMAANYRLL